MWQFCLRILAVVAVCVAQIDADPLRGAEKRSRNHYCGPNLSNMLMLVCQGQYNGVRPKKAEEDANADDPGYWIQPLSEEEPQFPFRARPHATSLISGAFRRFTRGVVDECCLKPCTYTELASYCQKKVN